MESAEIIPEWGLVELSLSNHKTIIGKLILDVVKHILENELPVEQLAWKYDDGDILSFEIYENTIDLMILFNIFSPNGRTSQFEHIVIQASQIEWQNIPKHCDEKG